MDRAVTQRRSELSAEDWKRKWKDLKTEVWPQELWAVNSSGKAESSKSTITSKTVPWKGTHKWKSSGLKRMLLPKKIAGWQSYSKTAIRWTWISWKRIMNNSGNSSKWPVTKIRTNHHSVPRLATTTKKLFSMKNILKKLKSNDQSYFRDAL